MLYKTNLCKFYAKGVCKRGQKCSWAHGESDIRPFPAFYKTRMCYNWIYFGTCDRDPCTYAHSQMELRGSGKALRLCNYYFRDGNCPKGSRCPMAHDVSQLDSSIKNQAVIPFLAKAKFDNLDLSSCNINIKGASEMQIANACFLVESLPGTPANSIKANQIHDLLYQETPKESDNSRKAIEWLDAAETFGWPALISNGSMTKTDPVDELWALLKKAGSDGTSLTTSCEDTLSPSTGDRCFEDLEHHLKTDSCTATPTDYNIFQLSASSSFENCKRQDNDGSNLCSEDCLEINHQTPSMWHENSMPSNAEVEKEVLQLAKYLIDKPLQEADLFEAN